MAEPVSNMLYSESMDRRKGINHALSFGTGTRFVPGDILSFVRIILLFFLPTVSYIRHFWPALAKGRIELTS